MMDATPRHAPEAELAVLGAMLQDVDAVEHCAVALRDHDFYRDGNRRAFAAMLRISRRGEAIDPVTLAEELRAAGDLESAGGLQFIASVLDAVPTSDGIRDHCRIVKDCATLRRIALGAHTLIQEAMSPSARAEDMLPRAEALMASIVAAEDAGPPIATVRDLLPGALAELTARSESDRDVIGLGTGLPALDAMTAGLQDEDLIVVGARPSQGKTAFGLGLVDYCAIIQGKPCGIFSLEMSKQSIVSRLICSRSNVASARYRAGRLRDSEYPAVARAMEELKNGAPILIDDRSTQTIHDVRAKARKWQRDEPHLALIVVDYLQLMSGGGKTENRQQEVSEISRGLKGIARDLGIPVVALSQLSRAVESRPDKRPIMSDLRDSGAVEQDADVIIFLFRPEYYFGPTDKNGNSIEGLAEIIVGKQRNGPVGTVMSTFVKHATRFEPFRRQGRDNPEWMDR